VEQHDRRTGSSREVLEFHAADDRAARRDRGGGRGRRLLSAELGHVQAQREQCDGSAGAAPAPSRGIDSNSWAHRASSLMAAGRRAANQRWMSAMTASLPMSFNGS
jgi:hypothetical protein